MSGLTSFEYFVPTQDAELKALLAKVSLSSAEAERVRILMAQQNCSTHESPMRAHNRPDRPSLPVYQQPVFGVPLQQQVPL